MKNITVGTRGSRLALIQANEVIDRIKNALHIPCVIEIVKTSGDEILDKPIDKIGSVGLFVKELEKALLGEEIDIAVHSMKDLPGDMPSELVIAAVPERNSPYDCLISNKYKSIDELPKGAVIGTSSVRRKALLLHYRPDLKFTDLRGNVTTRLEKLKTLNLDGIILAEAGINRLGLKLKHVYLIPVNMCLPAVGQGALCIQARKKDEELVKKLKLIEDANSRISVEAERSFLKEIGGGCSIPLACFAQVKNNKIEIEGLLSDYNGIKVIRERLTGNLKEAVSFGRNLAKILLEKGGKKFLEGLKNNL